MLRCKKPFQSWGRDLGGLISGTEFLCLQGGANPLPPQPHTHPSETGTS